MIVIGIIVFALGITFFRAALKSNTVLVTGLPSILFIVAGIIIFAQGIGKLQDRRRFEQDDEHLSPDSNQSTASQIREFKQLADEGIITQEEFEDKKKQLLEQSGS